MLKWTFLSSILFYGLIGYLMSSQTAEASTLPEQTRQTLTIALAAVFAMQALFAMLVLPRVMGANARGLYVVRLTVYEAGAIMGLVLAFLTHDPAYTLYFGAPAFLLILLAR